MDVRIAEAHADYVFAMWGRLAFSIWRGRAPLEAFERLEVALRDHLSRQSEPTLMLAIIERGAQLPGLEARLRLSDVLACASGQVERYAVVVEGDGFFRALSVRAIVSGATLLSKPAYPHRVFSSVGAAARFLVGSRRGAPAPHLVIRAVREARRSPPTSGYVGAPTPKDVGAVQVAGE